MPRGPGCDPRAQPMAGRRGSGNGVIVANQAREGTASRDQASCCCLPVVPRGPASDPGGGSPLRLQGPAEGGSGPRMDRDHAATQLYGPLLCRKVVHMASKRWLCRNARMLSAAPSPQLGMPCRDVDGQIEVVSFSRSDVVGNDGDGRVDVVVHVHTHRRHATQCDGGVDRAGGARLNIRSERCDESGRR